MTEEKRTGEEEMRGTGLFLWAQLSSAVPLE